MDYKYLTASAMTCGEHLRSAEKDRYEVNWPNDADLADYCDLLGMSLERRERFAAARGAVGGGDLQNGKSGRGGGQ